VHSTTKLNLFQVVYDFNPHAPIDLLLLPPSETTCFDASQRSEFILKMHETTKLNIEKMNEKYQIAGSKGRREVKLESGDLVWLHLQKEQFPYLRKSKPMSRDLVWLHLQKEQFHYLRKSKPMSRVDGPFKFLEKINDNTYKLELPPEFVVSPAFNISDL
jgi:hypothetical protein